MGLRIPKNKASAAVKSAGSAAKNTVAAVAKVVTKATQWTARNAANGVKAVKTDTFEAANRAMMKATSAGNLSLVHKELELARQIQNPDLAAVERDALLAQLRTLMGAESLAKLDPLPAECAPELEKSRAAGAELWDPAAETIGRWSDDKAAGPPSDPVNLYVHGSLAQIVRAFQKGGWSIASPEGPEGAAAYKKDLTAFGKSWAQAQLNPQGVQVPHDLYHAVNRMPLSTLFMNGQPQLVSLQANNHPVTGRDHFRIFATGKVDAEGRNVYAIAASRDAGLMLDPKSKSTAFSAHFTEHNADPERDYTLETLKAGGASTQVSSLTQVFPPGPASGLFSSDNKVYDVVLNADPKDR